MNEVIMNKEILFRGKRIDNDEWTEGYLFKSWNRTFLLWGMTGDVPNMVEVKHETVGQYTGLTDKNGKKIFEGDIVKFSHLVFNESRIGVISYEMNVTGFVLSHKGGYSWIVYPNEFYEVIGNIYDNPELLEVEND